MIHLKDWVSFFTGLIVAAAGVLPLLNRLGVGPVWFSLPWLPIEIFAYIVAAAGFYLVVDSVIEITNSNAIGWFSFLIAGVVMAVGIIQVLSRFNIGPEWFALPWLSPMVYYVIFAIEGIFLMIACFAMEL